MNDIKIESLLFKQVEKPKNYVHNKIVNVYDNNYRINLYCEYEQDNLTKKRICGSYFAKLLNKSTLQIVHSSDKV